MGGNQGFSQTLIMLLVGVFTIIGTNMVAGPLADATITAEVSGGFVGQFLLMFPFLMLVGGVIAMFGASFKESKSYSEGNPTSILMRAITVIIGAVMLPVLLTQLSTVNATYANDVCAIAADATSTACTGASSALGGPLAYVAGTAGTLTDGTKFVAVGTFAGLLPLAYILSLLNVAIPQIGARVMSGVATRRGGMGM